MIVSYGLQTPNLASENLTLPAAGHRSLHFFGQRLLCQRSHGGFFPTGTYL